MAPPHAALQFHTFLVQGLHVKDISTKTGAESDKLCTEFL